MDSLLAFASGEATGAGAAVRGTSAWVVVVALTAACGSPSIASDPTSPGATGPIASSPSSPTPTSSLPPLPGVAVIDLDATEAGAGVVVQGTFVRVALDTDLANVDASRGELVGRVPAAADVSMVADGAYVWASDYRSDVVNKLDPTTGQVVSSLSTEGPEGVLVAGGSLWVANHQDGTVTRFDRATGRPIAVVEVGPSGSSGPQTLAADSRYVYVAIPNSHSVARISIKSNKVVGAVEVPSGAVPCGPMTLDGNVVWVTSCAELNTAARLDFSTGTAIVTPDLGGYAGVGVMADEVVWLSVMRDGGGPDAARLVALDNKARVVAEYGLPTGGIDGAVGLGALWIAGQAGTLVKIPLAGLPTP